MKICVVTQQYKNIYSGVGLHANNLVNYLQRDGHSITLIVPENQNPIHHLSFNIKEVNNPKIQNNQARWFFLSFSFSKAIAELEAKQDFDLIHFTDVREAFFCKSKAPIVGNINDTYSADLKSILYYKSHYRDWFPRWVYYLLVHNIEKRKLSQLKCVIANSKFTYRMIRDKYQKSNIPLKLCYKSVDIDRYSSVFYERNSKNQENLQPVILFVGGNMQRKGVPVLIAAAPAVIAKYPQVKFILAGGDKAINYLKRKCKKLGILSNFIFTGWCSQDELLDHYKNATLFVMPSLTESLGVTFLEAMAAGVPVIGTDTGGIPEIIQNDINGKIIPVESPQKLASTINELLSNEPLRKEYASAALNTVKSFSVENMMNCTLSIYHEVLGNNTHSSKSNDI